MPESIQEKEAGHGQARLRRTEKKKETLKNVKKLSCQKKERELLFARVRVSSTNGVDAVCL
jgi:hypothetical protein